MYTLIFNNTNAVSISGNNTFTYNFPSGIMIKDGDTISLQMLQLPYCWFNITSKYNNNSFGYKLNGVQYNINIQDGFYTLTDLNNLLQGSMLANGHYLLDNNGNYVWFAQLSTNISLYAIQYDAFVIPTSLPSGYTNPANVLYNTVTIATPTCIQLVVLPNNFTNIIGFNNGSYPATQQGTIFSVISNITPNLTPVNSIVMRCNLVDNKYSSPTDSFYSFSPNTTFGSNINILPTVPAWINLKQGSHQNISIQFSDQNFNPLQLNDTNVTITLLIKSKGE